MWIAEEEPRVETQGFPCAVCGEMDMGNYGDEDDDAWPTRVGARVCDRCERRFPDSLLIACSDPVGRFALRLRTGEICEFQTAEVFGEFITLAAVQGRPIIAEGLPTAADQLDIRLSDVVWCTALPHEAAVPS